jgi:hypothetical protein
MHDLRPGEAAMSKRTTSRWLALGLTSAGAGVLGLTSIMTATFAFGDGGDVALITAGAEGVGDTTFTGPDPTFVTDVYNLYINPTQAPLPFATQDVFPGYEKTALDLPALDSGLVTDTQFDQATSELNTAITQTYTGDQIVVSSYSQSSTPATLEMIQLDKMIAASDPAAPNPDDLSFVFLGDLNNPNGGVFERFADLNPGIDYYTATPADTPYPTDIYTIQYDGVADFPQYPSDLPADLNALAGYTNVHLDYNTLTPAELATAVKEPTSIADVATTYYMIPTQDLPLLDPIRDIPGIGPAMADILQPDLRVLVDMGYNYNDFQADVPTPADFNYPDYNYANVDADLMLGLQQGLTAAQVDLGMLPSTDLPDIYPYVPYVPGGTIANPDLIEPGSASSVEPLQSLLPGLDASALTGDLSAMSTDLSTALSHLAPDFATTGLDSLLTSFLGLL